MVMLFQVFIVRKWQRHFIIVKYCYSNVLFYIEKRLFGQFCFLIELPTSLNASTFVT
jgi:hypothetical protein